QSQYYSVWRKSAALNPTFMLGMRRKSHDCFKLIGAIAIVMDQVSDMIYTLLSFILKIVNIARKFPKSIARKFPNFIGRLQHRLLNQD
ncbi:hypothetical protein, partial [Paenibacillus popilliae]|uniref:hypothetical protein n=1 Tax=Paenibacillus popilliae TaxID=78057 RepID=UPI001F2D5B32